MLWEIEMTANKRNWKYSEEYTSSSAHWNKKTKIESTPKITRALQLTEIEQEKLKVLRRVHEHFSLLKLKKRNGKYFKEYTCSSTHWNRKSKIENTPMSTRALQLIEIEKAKLKVLRIVHELFQLIKIEEAQVKVLRRAWEFFQT